MAGCCLLGLLLFAVWFAGPGGLTGAPPQGHATFAHPDAPNACEVTGTRIRPRAQQRRTACAEEHRSFLAWWKELSGSWCRLRAGGSDTNLRTDFRPPPHLPSPRTRARPRPTATPPPSRSDGPGPSPRPRRQPITSPGFRPFLHSSFFGTLLSCK